MIYMGEWNRSDSNQNAPNGDGKTLFYEIVPDAYEGQWDDLSDAQSCVYVFRSAIRQKWTRTGTRIKEDFMSDDYEMPPDPSEVDWKIESEGRVWEGDEVWPRYRLTPEKAELIKGKIYWSDADRLRMLGLLLENCGTEAVVRLGDPNVWRKAVAALDDEEQNLLYVVRTALRRYDDLSEYDCKGAVRFWKQTTSADFALFNTPGCETGKPSKTRNRVLLFWENRVRLGSAYQPSSDYDSTISHIERLSFTNEARTEATVWVKQVTEKTNKTKGVNQNPWQLVTEELRRQVTESEQSLPQKVTLAEQWRDTWEKRDGIWKWTRRVCLERFSL